MKKLYQLILLAAGAILLAVGVSSCTGEGSGMSFDELPVLQDEDLWAVFQAIPESVLPDDVKSPEVRSAFKTRFDELQDGVLGDGEGFLDKWSQSENSIYWSDYFSKPDDYVWSDEDEHVAHPYVNLHAFSGADGEKIFAVLKRGAYLEGEEEKEPDLFYWFDKASGKISSASLKLDAPYSEDQITEDALLLYGSENLFYAVKEKKYAPYYCDRGFKVMIEDVGDSGIKYEWDGKRFVRDSKSGTVSIYNYGFGNNIILGESVPFSVPGYKTESAESGSEYEHIYNLVKEGETEPTIVFHSDNDINIIGIEVCSERYANIYNIRPGMKVSECMQILDSLGEDLEDKPYISIVEDGNGFVTIYNGFDEDFFYKVRKEDYLGNEQFAPEARIARVCVANAAG